MGNISRDGRTNISASSGQETALYSGSWWGFAPGETVEFYIQVLKNGVVYYESVGPSGEVGNTISDGGSWSSWISIVGDTGYSWRVNHRYSPVGIKNGPMQWFTSAATAAAFGTQTVSNPGQYQLDFSGQWYPNTAESTATAYLYYKKTTDPGWTLWGNSGAQQGYGVKTYAETVTGLTAGTSYQFYLYVTRTTSTDITASGPVTSGSTLASTPVVTTEDASSVSHAAAVLNGTIDSNLLTTTESFVWNKAAVRSAAYTAANMTASKVITIGGVTYTFGTAFFASGTVDYVNATDMTHLSTITIGAATYTFVEDSVGLGEAAYANGTLPTAGKIITIGSITYTFVAAVAVDYDIKIEITADGTMANLEAAINMVEPPSTGDNDVAGKYMSPFHHPDVSATLFTASDQLEIEALAPGPQVITITTDETTITPTDVTGGTCVTDPGDVQITGVSDDTMTNLLHAILNTGGTPGPADEYIAYDFGSGPAANPDVAATLDTGADQLEIVALVNGLDGNNIDLLTDEATFTLSAATLLGGTDLAGAYSARIAATSDETMTNLRNAVNKGGGGVEGKDWNATAAHPDVVARLDDDLDVLYLQVPTNTHPSLTFTTDEATLTLATSDEAAFAQETTGQVFSNDGVTPFNAGVSGLDKQRTYYFKAKSVYTANGGGTLYGDEFSFTTGVEPGAAAVEEEHMQTIQFDGQYGQAKTVTFTLRSPSGSSSDLFYTGAAPVAADFRVYKDGAASAAATNGATQISTYLYSLVLTTAEMSAETIDVVIHDASGAAFRDQHIQIRTAMRLSEIDVDATNGPVDATALTLIGNDDGHGMLATSTGAGSDINAVLSSMWLRVAFAQTQGAPSGTKIKLDANASTTNDYYNGCVVVTLGGDGAGQARVIIGYNGGQREATVDTAWSTIPNNTTTYAIGPGARPWNLAPAAELGAVPSPTASYGEFLQLLFQRFAFKVDQTASAQTWYDSNGVAIFDRSVSDDGVTQTIEALANV
jgi:hypothetical protein